MTKSLTITLFLSFVIVRIGLAQRETDYELWTGAKLEYKLNKKFELEFEEQVRLNENISATKVFFVEPGVHYKFNKWIDFKFKYRFSDFHQSRNENRMTFDVRFEYDIPKNPIDIRYRFRFQDSKVTYTEQKINYTRHELTADMNLSKLVDPYLSYELFYLHQKNEIRTHRYSVGLKWKLGKDLDFNSFYLIDYQVNVKTPETQHIFGGTFSYSLN